MSVPSDAPPSYDAATAAASSSARPTSKHYGATLGEPSDASGMPASVRRSIEDEMRPLPDGWVRSYDEGSEHQFFVDTTKDPPRSIWTHPYDDEEYLSTLSAKEREHIQQESRNQGHATGDHVDMMDSHTDVSDEDEGHDPKKAGELPPRDKGKEKRGFGRKLKDKITGTTHEQRETERARRAERERKIYEQHQLVRKAMARAAQTGEPQLVGKDSNGKDVYVEPPPLRAGPAGYGYNANSYGYNPYGRSGYAYPNTRYAPPPGPYRRPYGGGYGGGYGLPLAGGLLGGLLIGDALGGGFF